jgi:hypothetical protein
MSAPNLKIIPYFIDSAVMEMKTLSMTLVRLRVLLEGGKRIWSDFITSLKEVKEELENNDIYGEIEIDEALGVAWVKVDAEKTPLSDFYTYEETIEKQLCLEPNALLWRTFRTLVDGHIILPHDLPEHELFKRLIKSKCLNAGQ